MILWLLKVSIVVTHGSMEAGSFNKSRRQITHAYKSRMRTAGLSRYSKAEFNKDVLGLGESIDSHLDADCIATRIAVH
jgi:hypothetical protein